VIFSFAFVLSLQTHHCNCRHLFANILKIRGELSSLSTVNKRPDLFWDLTNDCLNCKYNTRLPDIFVSYAIERIIIRKGEILKLEDEAILEYRLFSFSVAQEPIRPRPPHLRFLDPTVSEQTSYRTHLNEWSAHRRGRYQHNRQKTWDEHPCPQWDSNPWSQQSRSCRLPS